MGFFKREEKALAARVPREKLRERYEKSEAKLAAASKTGNIGAVKAAMKEHHKFEYAMLYQEFGRKKK